jgi:hypothetical protein
MTNKLAILGRVYGWLTVLSLFITLGGCYACVSNTETEYGSEELYMSGGKVKSAPITTTTGGDGLFLRVPQIAGVVFVISLIGWMLTSTGWKEMREEDAAKHGAEYLAKEKKRLGM